MEPPKVIEPVKEAKIENVPKAKEIPQVQQAVLEDIEGPTLVFEVPQNAKPKGNQAKNEFKEPNLPSKNGKQQH